MKTKWLSTMIGATALLASMSAKAEVGPASPFLKLYGVVTADGRARAAIERVERDCGYSEMLRSGPRPEDIARCNRAEGGAVALGKVAAGAALAALDRRGLNYGAESRLYDIVARAGDISVVEPLVHALELLGTPEGESRSWEATPIETALQKLTFAAIGERLPWESTPSADLKVEARAWRAWLAGHAAMVRDELLAERLGEERLHLADANVERAFRAASFLLDQPVSRDQGLAAMAALAARAGLDGRQAEGIEEKLEDAKRIPRAKRRGAVDKMHDVQRNPAVPKRPGKVGA